jgi:hypothetical protein
MSGRIPHHRPLRAGSAATHAPLRRTNRLRGPSHGAGRAVEDSRGYWLMAVRSCQTPAPNQKSSTSPGAVGSVAGMQPRARLTCAAAPSLPGGPLTHYAQLAA